MIKVQFPEKLVYLDRDKISQFLLMAFAEDIGPGDYSSLGSIAEDAKGTAQLIIKDSGILAGVWVALKAFSLLDPELEVKAYKNDGDKVEVGDHVMSINGKAQSILSAERVVLNILQRMSGIASKTAHLSKLIAHTNCKLLDTRKTTPNFRMFEKWAVHLGGGQNHRFALYDLIMLKDNHIDYAGGITRAVKETKDYLNKNNLDLKIEVETRNLEEVKEAIDANADIILLDNMGPIMLKEAVAIINDSAITEASGGITESTIAKYAETGVDFISVGALTHSYQSLDMSLKAKVN